MGVIVDELLNSYLVTYIDREIIVSIDIEISM